MNKKIKILALMDSPTVSTGFGILAKNILKKLNETDKYDITVVGINYRGTINKEDLEKYPYTMTPAQPVGYSDIYGRGRTIQILTGKDIDIKAGFDLLFTIQDHFILAGTDNLAEGYNFSLRIKQLQKEILLNEKVDKNYLFNWIGYYPVDGRLQDYWVTQGIALCDYPISYTEFGKDEMLRFDTDKLNLKNRVEIIPHGVNTKDFYPLKDEEIKEFRKRYFQNEVKDDDFLIVNVSRNQIRKDLMSTLKAYAEYKKINDKAKLYLHSKRNDVGGDLWEIAKQVGLKETDILLPINFNEMYGFPIETINKIYNSADVLLTTTLGEGWGFINTEAMAVNKIIIAPANSSIPEIIGMKDIYEKEVNIDYIEKNINTLRGIPVKSGYGLNDFICMGIIDNGVIRPKTDIEDIVVKLDWVYKNKDKANKIAQQGYNWVQTISWDNVVNKWEQIFDKAYNELEKQRKINIKLNRNDICFCSSGKKYKHCHGNNGNNGSND